LFHRVGQAAAKCLYHHLRRLIVDKSVILPPLANADAIQLLAGRAWLQQRGNAAEAGQVIHPQPHRVAEVMRQSTCQSPGDADITVVVDDGTENIPARGVESGMACRLKWLAQHSTAGDSVRKMPGWLRDKLANNM
jgi:hypothetical protein